MVLTKNDSQPLSFNGSEAIKTLKELFRGFKKAGINPYITQKWKKGIFRLFGVTATNLPDFNRKNLILLPNHISDFDAVILGLLHPRIRIIAKKEWTDNSELMELLNLHYHIVGVDRSSQNDNIGILKSSIKYLKDHSQVRHLLIFPQGTISDINKNSTERVNPGFAKLAMASQTDIVTMFTEYPGTDGPTRIICGDPHPVTDPGLDYRQIWLDEVIALQNSLNNVREPVLSKKHSLNNNPDEPYFK